MKATKMADDLYMLISRRLLLFVYLLLFLIAVASFDNLLAFRINSSLDIAERNLLTVQTSIGDASTNAANHLRILQHVAQENFSKNRPSSLHPLFLALKENPDKKSYSLQTLPAQLKKEDCSYLVGGGTLPEAASSKANEIELALRLNPLLKDIKQQVPNATWIYYYSANYFINMYPFEPQALLWSDAWMTHPLFTETKPDKNPQRLLRWHEVYIDEAGKGLMTSLVAPVFDKQDHFRAMVGIDFTLGSLRQYLSGPGLEIGTPLLVDNHGNVLADPVQDRLAETKVPQLQDLLPPPLQASANTLLTLPANQYHDIADWKVFAMDIENTPWRLIFIVDLSSLWWQTLSSMWVEALALFLLLTVLGGVDQRYRLSQNLLMFKAAVDSNIAAIIITDIQSRIQYANDSFTTMTGYSSQEVAGKKISLLKSGQTPQTTYRHLWSTVLAGESWRNELLNRKKDGTLYWASILISPVTSKHTNRFFIVVMEDITERKSLQEKLHALATTDELTGLTNRRHFFEIAKKELARAARYTKPISVLMLDIDYFKQVNDTAGHAAGDLLLQKFAQHCLSLIRPQDCLSRLGGEEFALLLPETTLEQAWILGERIRKSLEHAQFAVSSNATTTITCSIGAAQKLDTDDTFEALLSRADAALYVAKSNGRNQVCKAPQ